MNEQRTQNRAQEFRAAYHEAGHVVACLALNIPFEHVTIVPDHTSKGQVLMAAHIERLLDTLEREGDMLEDDQAIFNIIVMIFPGEAGTPLCPIGLSRRGEYSHQSDFEQAILLAYVLAEDKESRAGILRRAQAQAVNLITFHPTHIQQVNRLAKELLKHETLNYAEVQSLFEEAKEANA